MSTIQLTVGQTVEVIKGLRFVGKVEDVTTRAGQVLVRQPGHPGHSLWVSVHDVLLVSPVEEGER